MNAQLIIRDRRVFEDGCIMEVVVWKVPLPVPPAEHGLKYRLFYSRSGERLIGYDNERGKRGPSPKGRPRGAHTFTTLAPLLDEFEADVIALRGGVV